MAKQKVDAELEACVTDLETLKGQLETQPPVVGAADGDPVPAPKAIDPGTIIAIIEVVLKLIERFRKK